MEDNFEELKKTIKKIKEKIDQGGIAEFEFCEILVYCIADTLIEKITNLENEIADLKKKKKREAFTPPTLQECIDYAKEKNFVGMDIQEYWESRERTGWCLANKAKIKKWTLDMNLMYRKGYYGNSKSSAKSFRSNTDTTRRNDGAYEAENS